MCTINDVLSITRTNTVFTRICNSNASATNSESAIGGGVRGVRGFIVEPIGDSRGIFHIESAVTPHTSSDYGFRIDGITIRITVFFLSSSKNPAWKIILFSIKCNDIVCMLQ